MINPLTYYDKIKEEQHVFIYCVAGRSSSTAFQRLLNSSNKVWIWGERHGLIDDTVALISRMRTYHADHVVQTSLNLMYQSYTENKHLSFYPNAIGNLDTTIAILNSSVANTLKPWAAGLRRFGFKEIEIRDIQTLRYLKEIFPKSALLFCFRDPLTQWPSVNKLKDWWLYGKELELFLTEYYRASAIYLEFQCAYGLVPFIENTDLKDLTKIKKIIAHLNIPSIDPELLNVEVGSARAGPLSAADRAIILMSAAYKNYQKMRNLSASFYKI